MDFEAHERNKIHILPFQDQCFHVCRCENAGMRSVTPAAVLTNFRVIMMPTKLLLLHRSTVKFRKSVLFEYRACLGCLNQRIGGTLLKRKAGPIIYLYCL